jgi:hypothetical protein
MQTPSPWATRADVEAAREELKADIAALHANLTAMHGDLRAVQALLTEQNKRRPWWRRLFAAGVVLMTVMAASAEVQASFKDGNKLYAECTGDDAGVIACHNYIEGIIDALRAVDPFDAVNQRLCLPVKPVGQYREIVVRYLTAHPETRHEEAEREVLRALTDAFPCK